MKLRNYLLNFAGIVLLTACSSANVASEIDEPTSGNSSAPDNQTSVAATKAPALCKGADISWLSEMEASGIKFFYKDGKQGECMDILKSLGMNALRFRLWVNPSNQWSSTADVVKQASKAAALGFDIMIDFHYSDSWADPGKQTVPSEWSGLGINDLQTALISYTEDVCIRLKSAGVEPKWVQIGNETGNGMLWPLGQADKNPQNYARLTSAGTQAVKSVFPNAKTIVHIQNGQDKSLATWLFGILKKYNADYDICGFSLYPEKNNYQQYLKSCSEVMKMCIDTFDKDVMLCEVGMGVAYVSECETFLRGCFDLGDSLGSRYLGALYWEPQAYNDWKGYKKGAFDSKGQPTAALNAYKDGDSGIKEIKAD